MKLKALIERWNDDEETKHFIKNPMPIVKTENGLAKVFDVLFELEDEEAELLKSGKMTDVPIEKLISLERKLDPKAFNGIRKVLKRNPKFKGWDHPSIVLQLQRGMYLIDGNHRASVAFSNGAKTITAFVLDGRKKEKELKKEERELKKLAAATQKSETKDIMMQVQQSRQN